MEANGNASPLSPIVVNGWVLHSIFDDADHCYHSDAVSHQTPAEERKRSARRSLEDAATIPHIPSRRTP